eukprot:1530479-Amphidinium_carterae.1
MPTVMSMRLTVLAQLIAYVYHPKWRSYCQYWPCLRGTAFVFKQERLHLLKRASTVHACGTV